MTATGGRPEVKPAQAAAGICPTRHPSLPDRRQPLPDYRASQLEPGGLLVFTWRDGGPPARRPLRELGSRQVGRHTYAIFSEILESGQEGAKARYLHRISQDGKVISEEELIGYAYRPPWNVIARELAGAGFTQTDAPEGLLAWRRLP